MRKKFSFKPLATLFLSFLFLCIGISATSNLPNPKDVYLNDYAGTLNATHTNTIRTIGQDLEKQTGVQATVVIISSTSPLPIEDYSLSLFRTWGIGQKGKDNGLLLLVAIQDRAYRIEVGRGLEGIIPDALSNHIMEAVAKPYFSNGDYGTGITEAYRTFATTIAKEYDVTLNTTPITTSTSSPSFYKSGGKALILIIILLVLDLVFNRGRIFYLFSQIAFWSSFGRRGGGGSGGYGGGGGFGGGSSNGGGSSGNW